MTDTREADDYWDALCELVHDLGYEAVIELGAADDSAWAVEVRITVNPNDRERPDLSAVLFLAGHSTAAEALGNGAAAALEWLVPRAKVLRAHSSREA
jgi:hypothetical protein